MEWLHQYSELAPYEECVGGGKEGGWYWWWAGQPFLRAEQCDGLEQSSSTGGVLDWPGPVRAPRPAKMQGTAPVQTRELAALFLCLSAGRPGLEQYATPSPLRSHSDTIRIHSEAMKTSPIQSVYPGGGNW